MILQSHHVDMLRIVPAEHVQPSDWTDRRVSVSSEPSTFHRKCGFGGPSRAESCSSSLALYKAAAECARELGEQKLGTLVLFPRFAQKSVVCRSVLACGPNRVFSRPICSSGYLWGPIQEGPLQWIFKIERCIFLSARILIGLSITRS